MGKIPSRFGDAGRRERAETPVSALFLEAGRRKELAAFQKTAGFRFKSLELLNLSFMHRSVSNESSLAKDSGGKINNERLEFLGDSVLGAVCATLLYNKYPDKSEGELAKIKAARVLQIDNVLILGRGEEMSGGRAKKAILADALEALIGALYLDSGYRAAFEFVSRCIGPEIERVTVSDNYRDFKSILQELCQQRFRVYPEYCLVKKSGPEHERRAKQKKRGAGSRPRRLY